jgi:hypothetical protein
MMRAASIFRPVGRTIRHVLAAAQAVDLLNRVNVLNKVWVVEAFGTKWRIGIPLIMIGEPIHVAINATRHLGITVGLLAVVDRSDKARTEDFGKGNGVDEFCAEGDGLVIA